MGSRGRFAGGFGYMEFVTCPRCGMRRRLGWQAIADGHIQCSNREKCEKRRKKGHLLHRIKNTEGE